MTKKIISIFFVCFIITSFSFANSTETTEVISNYEELSIEQTENDQFKISIGFALSIAGVESQINFLGENLDIQIAFAFMPTLLFLCVPRIGASYITDYTENNWAFGIGSSIAFPFQLGGPTLTGDFKVIKKFKESFEMSARTSIPIISLHDGVNLAFPDSFDLLLGVICTGLEFRFYF